MLNCDQIARELSDALDGETPFWRVAQIKMHLAICRPCRAMSESLDRTVEVLHELASRCPLSDREEER